MSRGGATVELDFFAGIDNAVDGTRRPPSESRFHRILRRQRSHRDIQLGAISKIDPMVLKSVINDGLCHSPPATLPLYHHTPSSPTPSEENATDVAPLTIFYNGSVVVFDLPRDKAESIMKLAEKGLSSSLPPKSPADQELSLPLDSVSGADLPIARRKSLQRFLEKRKERLTTLPPTPHFAPAA
ncbi:Protein TIFY 9 [Linum perenne]